MVTVSRAVSDAKATLAAAGVASALNDAQLLAAHVLNCTPMQLIFHGDEGMPVDYQALVQRRAAREPLQHIVGFAPFGELDLQVGPGVFVPRPETELLADHAVSCVRQLIQEGVDKPRVLDLCTGSGALALYLVTAVPKAEVTAVELDPQAAVWTKRNIERLADGVRLVMGDACDPQLLAGEQCFDVVVSNPPYVPEGVAIEPEVQADPHHAVFSGADGMTVIRKLVPNIARLLRPGGMAFVEHDDSTAGEVVAEFERAAVFADIHSRQDFAGRDRYVTAVRLGE